MAPLKRRSDSLSITLVRKVTVQEVTLQQKWVTCHQESFWRKGKIGLISNCTSLQNGPKEREI